METVVMRDILLSRRQPSQPSGGLRHRQVFLLDDRTNAIHQSRVWPAQSERSSIGMIQRTATEDRGQAAVSAGDRILAKFAKKSSAYFLATPLMRRPPSWAILPPTLASTS